ncbi:hypothetical protein AMAG_05194 [Allomyces macrogynus ATCC 38327]|uniref:BTB domain-containing protein n=1 Tax=Allomyces macrogynus (strain ATCC 38327) TaxID=578462 RepID=A0A0L0SBG1_ALLM3|nr:hypothetical protein AMAG_05194 [Allomyces macrogynus ATCC 38327]|eukprot:KNE59730.1 hypothetical protein AMAG_05194 [Allomyces macrogynus ATCC 38327]
MSDQAVFIKSAHGFSLFMFLQPKTGHLDPCEDDSYNTAIGKNVAMEFGLVLFWEGKTVPKVLDGKALAISCAFGYTWSASCIYGGKRTESYPFSMNVDPLHSGVCVISPLLEKTISANSYFSNMSLAVTINLTAQASLASGVDHSMLLPHSLGFLAFLNDPTLCDCYFLAKDAPGPLYASLMMLARASPFFRTMFSGDWAESAPKTEDPIKFTSWHAAAVALTFIHIYSGWLPGTPLPKGALKRVRSFSCDPTKLEYPTWRNMFELAQMLELKALTLAINRQLVALLEAQFQELGATKATCGVRDEDFESNDGLTGL